MRMFFGVLLGVELKDGVRLEWNDGQRFAVSESGTQLASNEEIAQRIKDVLADVTKHDDTTMWRVVDVIEGTELVVDGKVGSVVLIDEREGEPVDVTP